jgi:hypothetical protein
MRLGFRLILPPLLAVTALSLFLSLYQVKRDRRIRERELSRPAELLADSLEENIAPALGSPIGDLCDTRIEMGANAEEEPKAFAAVR